LFYRLNVIPVRVPALRERRADIPLLSQFFLEQFAKDAGAAARGRVTIAQDAQQALMAYEWPGNVRQLENVIERAFALSPGRSQIDATDLPPELLQQLPVAIDPAEYVLPEPGVDLEQVVAKFEHALIKRALERTDGNKSQAADLLQLKRTTLIEKLKRLERI
jgi:DNA-binding NtrC family response regulator